MRERGQVDKADQVPPQVDREQHGDLLSKFGIDPSGLLKLAGGGVGRLGGKLGL